MLQRILVATDLGASAERALELAVSMAERFQAELSVLHVFEVPGHLFPAAAFTAADCLAPALEDAERRLHEALSRVRARCPRARALLRSGAPWEEILATIDEVRPDVVVLGTHGRRGVAHGLLGSVAEKMVRLARVPVLTVR